MRHTKLIFLEHHKFKWFVMISFSFLCDVLSSVLLPCFALASSVSLDLRIYVTLVSLAFMEACYI